MKSNPLLPPPAVSVVAAASAEHEKHNDNQNGSHSFLQKCASGNFPPLCGFGVIYHQPRNLLMPLSFGDLKHQNPGGKFTFPDLVSDGMIGPGSDGLDRRFQC
jgi:hypothetical protein